MLVNEIIRGKNLSYYHNVMIGTEKNEILYVT